MNNILFTIMLLVTLFSRANANVESVNSDDTVNVGQWGRVGNDRPTKEEMGIPKEYNKCLNHG